MKDKSSKLLLLANQQLLAASETRSWQEEYQFDRGATPRLVVDNVWGGHRTTRLPKNASADLHLDVGNGSISSDFELAPLAMPATIEKNALRDRSSRYRISKPIGLRLGRGGANMKFESLNGDIEINQNHQEYRP